MKQSTKFYGCKIIGFVFCLCMLFSINSNAAAYKLKGNKITNGKTSYFTKKYSKKWYLCKKTKGKTKKLKKIQSSKEDDYCSMKFKYKNCLYLTYERAGENKQYHHTYIHNTKKNKLKKVKNCDLFYRKGSYAIGIKEFKMGDATGTLSLYKLKKNGMRKVTTFVNKKGSISVAIYGDAVYYAMYPNYWKKAVVHLCKYNIKSKKTETLGVFKSDKELDGTCIGIDEITNTGCKVNIGDKTYHYIYSTKNLK